MLWAVLVLEPISEGARKQREGPGSQSASAFCVPAPWKARLLTDAVPGRVLSHDMGPNSK